MHIFDFFRDIFSVFGAFSRFFGCKIWFRKSCPCKRNDKYEVCPRGVWQKSLLKRPDFFLDFLPLFKILFFYLLKIHLWFLTTFLLTVCATLFSYRAYLIFVISFTRAKFLENEIYTEERVNYDKQISRQNSVNQGLLAQATEKVYKTTHWV